MDRPVRKAMPRNYVRFAFYFAPDADSVLGRFGNAWLGFDPSTGENLPRPEVTGMGSDEIARITESPSRYGFHGTLSPPFFLAKGYDIEDVDGAGEKLAAGFKAFDIPAFRVKRIGRFVALAPGEPSFLLEKLAAACVREAGGVRALPDEASLRRRRQAELTDRQEELLNRWGYPYVLEEFRFHLTLSGALDTGQCARLQETLQEAVSVFAGEPQPMRDIALFGDPGDGGRFRLLKRYPLG